MHCKYGTNLNPYCCDRINKLPRDHNDAVYHTCIPKQSEITTLHVINDSNEHTRHKHVPC